MIRNYLKIALRNLLRHRLFSFINIFGLALSMSVCMMVIMSVKRQFTYDKFHPDADRTVRILSEVKNTDNSKFLLASTPLPLIRSIHNETTVVEDAVNVYPALNEKAVYEGKSIAIDGAFTSPSFFKVFGFRLIKGNAATALQQPNSIVLTEATATKFFGNADPVGKILSFRKAGDFLVTGVLKNSGRSHIEYEAYASISTVPQLEKAGILPSKLDNWDSFQQGYTYVLLRKNANASRLNNVLQQVANLINKETQGGSFAFKTQPLNAITPSSLQLMNDIGSGTDWSKIWTEIGIALLILLAACFNYTNLTIARALTRAKEVGIRKVSGAKRHQVFTQYVVESIVIALLSLGLALVFLQLILTYQPFNDGYEMVPVTSIDLNTFLLFLAFSLTTGAIAGSAPAWILSSFKPVLVLKNISTHKLFGNLSLQKSLIVFQFSLSLVVLIFLSAFYRQFSYIGATDHRFRKDNVVTVELEGGSPALFANAASRVAGVESITAISGTFGERDAEKMSASLEKNNGRPVELNYYYSDTSLVRTMGLRLLAGSNFPANSSYDEERFILINEKAVQAFGFKNNAEAINRAVWVNDSTSLQIMGVINDFYYQGVGRYILPLAIRSKNNSYTQVNIFVQTADRATTTEQLRDAWNKTFPGKAFNYAWLDKKIEAMNRQTATISLLGFLAFIAATIASLGLLGLVVYTVETRRKEISIRKVIGGSISHLMKLLSKGFIKLLLIAGLIALPIGYVLSAFFLQGFANRVELGIGWPLLCVAFLLLIGLFTILSQTYRASAANPVDSLRTE
ncbi:MAG TPA: ABC transporter permease [Chitinophagaceae bacterium]|nr:ABC transporter permease [Chitinophagaceae bacterium]